MIDVRNRFINPEGRVDHAGNRRLIGSAVGIAAHHSVTATLPVTATIDQELAVLKSIEAYHVSIGYGLFAYHAAAFPSGRCYQIGNWNGQRAHVEDRNHELVGIVAVGTFTDGLPGPAQMAAMAEGIREIRGFWEKRLQVRGHNLWTAPGNSGTACAGAGMNAMGYSDWERLIETTADSGQEEIDMQHPLWAEWKDRPDHIPYRTYVLFATPEGLRKRFVPSAEEHNALLASQVAGDAPKPLSIWTLKMFAGGPEPDEP